MSFEQKDVNQKLFYGDPRLGQNPPIGHTLNYKRYLADEPNTIYVGLTQDSLNGRANNGIGYFNTGLRQAVGINGMKGIVSEVYAITPSDEANKVEHDEILALKAKGYQVYNLNEGSSYIKNSSRKGITNNYREQGLNKAVVDVINNGTCTFDKEVYLNEFIDKYLAPGQSPTYSKHGFHVSQGGYIGYFEFVDGKKKHRTVAHELPKIILGEHYTKLKPTRTTFIDKDKRNFQVKNVVYGGNTLAYWIEHFNIVKWKSLI